MRSRFQEVRGASACAANRGSLPAVAAISAVAPATAAATATAAAISAATAAATAALGLGTRFIHHQIAPAEILAVQRIDGPIGFLIIGDFNESKTPRLTREAVPNQIHRRGADPGLYKIIVDLVFRCGKRKITNIELLHLRTPSARNRKMPVAERAEELRNGTGSRKSRATRAH